VRDTCYLFFNHAHVGDMVEKLHPPVAVCTQCGTPTRLDLVVNEPHLERVDGDLCRGIFRAAFNANEWAECDGCGVTGFKNGEACQDCNGYGWLNIQT
jgi:hypothetical protein